jgi:hypothetical protein
MKAKERNLARKLRRKGWSLRMIAHKIGCAKSSVSMWIRDIPLSKGQIERLKSSQDQGRAKAANHPNSPKLKWQNFREEAIREAQKEIKSSPATSDIKFLGTALYWAEGYNRGRNLFVFANRDPDMIVLMGKFLREICSVPEAKMRGRVNLHPGEDVEKAQKYWSRVSRIPLKQFHRPLLSVSRSSKRKRKNLPYGTFRIIVSDVFLCSRIKGWIQGVKSWTISSAG